MLARIGSAYRKYGLRKSAYLVIRNLLLSFGEYRLKRFDKKFRISTIGDVPIRLLDVMGENKEFYEGYYSTPLNIVKRYISALPQDLSDYVFIDIGSGKGRILAYASQYDFKKIRGLEFASELHAVSEDNIKSMSSDSQRCKDIKCIHANAAHYEFPDENLVIFMFNPFHAEVLSEVLKNLKHHHSQYNKKIYIGYYNPRYGYLLESCDFLQPLSIEPPLLYVSVHAQWPIAGFESITPSDQ